jgi:opacity protein-like surface antigen
MKTTKKIVMLLALIAISTAVFAQETSFRPSLGIGGSLDANFSTWFVDKDVPGDLYRYNSSSLGVAPYLFLDLKYAELNLGLGLGKTGDFKSANPFAANPNFPAETLSLRGGAYFKLPFSLSNMFTLYPLLGAEYELFLAARKDDDRDAKFPISSGTQDAKPIEALSTVSFKTGIGLDTFFTDNIFLRTELLYGIRVPNKFEKYQADVYTDVNSKLFHGGDFKIAIGYRF